MNIQDIQEWFLDAVPIKRKSAADWIVPAFVGLGVGVAIGAGVGLLFAPSTGEETRLRLREGADRVRGRAAELAGHAKERVGAAAEEAQGSLSRA